ncbi:UDP-glucose_4-epimerase [Hexamita inflata]|uniref:UDP-glucose 4-epimerase n=1 Tax=Hexamita inflata TaxID=28002 RepID=A0AA86RK08_9EUKA|nr:UDP-glucose 4-epimerase [Hexamita inflata]
MHYLITGGAGFIGSHFVEHLANDNQITVFDNYSTGHNIFKHKNVNYVTGDITDLSSLQQLQQPVDVVIHLAAALSVTESMTNPAKYHKINVLGSQNVYDTASRLNARTIVSASSAAVYGDCGRAHITESFPYAGISPYASSKFEMEQLHSNSAKMIFTRFFNVYGPRQDPRSPYTGVITAFMQRARSNQPLTIFGDGKQTRDFVFVKDLVRFVVDLVTFGAEGIFNIGTELETSIADLANIISTFGSGGVVFGAERNGDIKYSVSDCSKLKGIVSFDKKTVLEKGVEKTWEWFVKGNGHEWIHSEL